MTRRGLHTRLARIEADRAEAEALGVEVVALVEQLAAGGADLTDVERFLDQAVAARTVGTRPTTTITPLRTESTT